MAEIKEKKMFNIELKNYTTRSLDCGMLTVDDILNSESVKASNVAVLTDHSTLSSAPEFVEKCFERGVKPIIGVTVNIKDGDNVGELTLYAKNEKGFDNLKKIVSSTSTDEKTKIVDFSIIESHCNDLIAYSGGVGTVLNNNVKNNSGDFSHAEKLKDVFNEDFYIEINSRPNTDLSDINKSLISYANKNNINYLASNNNRMLKKSHFELLKQKVKKYLGVNDTTDLDSYLSDEDFVRTSKQNFKFYFSNNKKALFLSKSKIGLSKLFIWK